LGNKNLEAMLQIALEGLDDEVDDVLCDVVFLWKNNSKYRFLYANLSLYLNGLGGFHVSSASFSFGVLYIDGSGTQMS